MRTTFFSTIFLFICSCSMFAQQQSRKDSLDLIRLLSKEGELKLNINAVKQIDFGTFGSKPLPSTNRIVDFDATLPKIYTDSLKRNDPRLSLHPYNPQTKYDWDPILNCKIKIDKNTWRGNPFQALFIPGTGKRAFPDENPMHPDEKYGYYRPNFRLASGVTGSSVGASVGGMDLMYIFTKDFWDFKNKKLRKRAQEVLENYGDSITVSLDKGFTTTPVAQP